MSRCASIYKYLSLGLKCLFFVAQVNYVSAQTHRVEGVITDTYSNTIDSALIIVKTNNGDILDELYSDKNGFWSVELKLAEVSLCFSKELYIDTCIIFNGYNVSLPIKISLKELGLLLNEVRIVQSRMFDVIGDTTFYYKKYFQMEQDRSIGDVIGRIPQFSWDKNGRLLYKGKLITGFNLNGFEIFNKNYAALKSTIHKDNIDQIAIVSSTNENSEVEYSLQLTMEDSKMSELLGNGELSSNIHRNSIAISPYLISKELAANINVLAKRNSTALNLNPGDYDKKYFLFSDQNPFENMHLVQEPELSRNLASKLLDIFGEGNLEYKFKSDSRIKINWNGTRLSRSNDQSYEIINLLENEEQKWKYTESSLVSKSLANISYDIKVFGNNQLSIDVPFGKSYLSLRSLEYPEDKVAKNTYNKVWKDIYIQPVISFRSQGKNVSNLLICKFKYFNNPNIFLLVRDSMSSSDSLISQNSTEFKRGYLLYDRISWSYKRITIFNALKYEKSDVSFGINTNNLTKNIEHTREELINRSVVLYKLPYWEFANIIEAPIFSQRVLEDKFIRLSPFAYDLNIKYKGGSGVQVSVAYSFNKYYGALVEIDSTLKFNNLSQAVNGLVASDQFSKSNKVTLNVNLLRNPLFSYSIVYSLAYTEAPSARHIIYDSGVYIFSWVLDKRAKSHNVNTYFNLLNKYKHNITLTNVASFSVNTMTNDALVSSYFSENNLSYTVPIKKRYEILLSANLNYNLINREAIYYESLLYGMNLGFNGNSKSIQYKIEYGYSFVNSNTQKYILNNLNFRVGYLFCKKKATVFLQGINVLNKNSEKFVVNKFNESYAENYTVNTIPVYFLVGINYLR